jgi:hypothetical protein
MAKESRKNGKKIETGESGNQPLDGTPIDYGTPELRMRGNYVMEEVRGTHRKRLRRIIHPLDHYLAREWITGQEYLGGTWIFNDYAASHQFTTIIGRCMDGNPHLRSEYSAKDFANPYACGERHRRAMKTLNRVSQTLVQNVCIEGLILADFIGEMGWSRRNSGIDRLREALGDLYAFYVADRKAQRDFIERMGADNA